MLSNSWVIIERDTKKVIMETWNEHSLKYLKPDFIAIPTHKYLFELNKNIAKGWLCGD